jgi:transposase
LLKCRSDSGVEHIFDCNALERLQGPRPQGLSVALVVLEATGGFEATVAAALAGVGLPLCVVNPRQIRDFARAMGRLAKTDTLDAEVIALFATPRPAAPPRPPDRPAGSAQGLDLKLEPSPSQPF